MGGFGKGRDRQAVEEVGGGLFRTWRSMEKLATRQGVDRTAEPKTFAIVFPAVNFQGCNSNSGVPNQHIADTP